MTSKKINKRGSITVFLMSILVTMIMASLVFVHAARQMAAAGSIDAILMLAGRSVLSEYDTRLKEDYGLFAFYGFENEIEKLVKFYAGKSVELDEVDVSLAGHSMLDVETFETQVLDYMNYMIAEQGIDYVKDRLKKTERPGASEKREEKTLVNESEIRSLPSEGVDLGGIDIKGIVNDGLPSMDQILDESTSAFRLNEYILSQFKYKIKGDKKKSSFFEYEVEYILHGKLSDAKNLKKLSGDFRLLRTALNAAHIYADPDKRAATLAAAQVVTPGAPAGISQAVIVAAWAGAEAENDLRLLMNGNNVALMKTDATWAISLANALNETEGRGYITPSSNAGVDYEGYLRLFLYLEKKETKLLRMMDLIQLNLRGSYYRDFLLKNYNAGFSMEALAEGKRFSYEQKY